jgi:hypothetical protein
MGLIVTQHYIILNVASFYCYTERRYARCRCTKRRGAIDGCEGEKPSTQVIKFEHICC